MSGIRWAGVRVRGTRRAEKLNDLYDAIEAAGLDLGAVNVAEEGLHRRALASGLQVERAFTPLEYQVRGALTPSATFIAYNPGGGAFTSSAVALGASEVLVLRARVQLETTLSSGMGLGDGSVASRLDLRLAYNDGTWHDIPGTLRSVQGVRGHPWLALLGVVEGPLTISGGVGLRYKLTPAPGGVAYPTMSLLYGHVHKRLET